MRDITWYHSVLIHITLYINKTQTKVHVSPAKQSYQQVIRQIQQNQSIMYKQYHTEITNRKWAQEPKYNIVYYGIYIRFKAVQGHK